MTIRIPETSRIPLDKKDTIRSLVTALIALFICISPAAAQDYEQTRQTQGIQSNAPHYMVVDADHLHTSPTQAIKAGRLVIQNGKILRVGKQSEVAIPDGVPVVRFSKKRIYPGFINAYKSVAVGKIERKQAYWNDRVRPEMNLVDRLTSEQLDDAAGRESGITSMLLAPSGAIVDGTSCLVLNGGAENPEHRILKSSVFQHAKLTASWGGGFRGYPNSPMGAVALARQSFYDAKWYKKAWQVAAANPKVKRPEFNRSLQALAPTLEGKRSLVVQTSNELFALRADRFAKEFGVPLVILGSGNEYRRVKEIAETGRWVICPVNFPKAPDVKTTIGAKNATLEQLMHWDHAPENPSRLAKNQVPFCFTTNRLSSSGDLLKQVRTAVKRGLDPSAALAALTTAPAKLFGMEDQVGTLTKGSYANFVVVDGDLFESKTKVLETWISGKRYQFQSKDSFEIAGNWNFEVQATDDSESLSIPVKLSSSGTGSISISVKSEKKKKDEESSDKKEEEKPFKLSDAKRRDVLIDGLLKGGTLKGVAQWNLVLDTKKPETISGKFVWPGGDIADLVLTKIEPEKETPKEGDEKKSESKVAEKDQKSQKVKESASKPNRASFAVNYPLGAFGKSSLPVAPKRHLFQNFTVWTSGKEGILKEASVLIGDGKILKIFKKGEQLPGGDDVVVFQGDGQHLTPGIIDCHSHMASDSGINESGQAITAEVRIGDMIDCDDITIYRQLAGGTTTANVLHGSANPIGGQNQVVKLRWGAGEQAMKFAEAPAGIKFALGENVKRSTSRYPTTRMGVQQIMQDAFYAATEYRLAHRQWQVKRTGLPPRIDLELEALAEIIEGKRWVHCHSYRQDEILALIRTLQKFNVQIGTFQHILEGYKVADAMDETDAMASAFADWWAYKLEVADAIPYAGKLMHDAGVIVSFNSDDDELGRRLNHEAAKAVKYGGLSPAEALKFVTLNPAKQLRIEKYVGSIESGKHADIVIWNGSPLSPLSRVDQTWIDGRKYFDREIDLQQRKKFESMRQTLIQKVLDKNSAVVKKGEKVDPDEAKLWPRFDEFCKAKGRH